MERIQRGEITIREIQQDEPVGIAFGERYRCATYVTKIAPKHLELPTDNAIYGNKIAIFSYKSEPMAVVIESEDVAQTYRSLFEMAWASID